MPIDNCETQISQTRFLGCSVTGFTASLGWGGQQSTLDVSLVQDSCYAPEDHPKHYWDANLIERTTVNPDPGFFGESGNIIGCPVFFRCGNYEFSGLVQSWSKSHSSSGNPTYQVQITDPRLLLENTQLITGEFSNCINVQANGCVEGGSVSPYNLFNIYAWLEMFGVACPSYTQTGGDGAIMGTSSGGFGGSLSNENGISYNRIKQAINVLINSGITNCWSSHPGIVYNGTTATPGEGLIGPNYGAYTQYILDISRVGVGLPDYVRINSPSMSVMELINTITEMTGCDYFIELIPVQTYLVISVNVVSRSSQPSLGVLDSFIAQTSGVISKEYGRENRNEVTSSFIMGGKKQTIFQASSDFLDMDQDEPGEADNIILPFFGLDSNKDMIIPEKDDDGWWQFDVETWEINTHLQQLFLPASVTINEKELLCALYGYDSWASYVCHLDTDTSAAFKVHEIGIFNTKKIIALIEAGAELAGRDVVGGEKAMWIGAAEDAHQQMDEDIHAIFDWVLKFANEYYGRKFAIRVPYVCGYTDSESGKVFMSSQPGDGGWTEVADVIGLPQGILLDFFSFEDGRVGPFLRYDDGEYELGDLDPNDIGIYNVGGVDKLFVRASIEPDYVYHDWDTRTTPRVVMSINRPILERETTSIAKFMRLLVKLIEWKHAKTEEQAKEIVEKMLKIVGSKDIFEGVQSRAFMPEAAAIPIHSNILTYGPWAGIGPPGQIRVEHNEGLVPWEYGGCATMSAAGAAIALEGLTNMTVGESGSVTVPGYPIMPLGAELMAYYNGYYAGNVHLFENRTITTTNFNENDYNGNPISHDYYTFNYGGFNGSNGPNVTQISVDVGEQGVTTTYRFRTHTPKFGLLGKINAERLKTAGQGMFQFGRKLRAWNLQRIQKGLSFRRTEIMRNSPLLKKADDGRIAKAATPHEVFVGEIIDFTSGYKRSIIETLSMAETPIEMSQNYYKKAFMSLDGLIRPISMDGDGGLPRFAQSYKASCQYSHPIGSMPPFYDGTCIGGTGDIHYAGQSVNEYVTIDYLNPFTNPNGFSRSYLATNRTATPTVGHDMDILGRVGIASGYTPESGLVMPVAGWNDAEKSDYQDDYRMMGLRGPLVMHGWGYDTDGKPIPNSADTEIATSGGTFTNTNLTCNFLDSFLRKPHTWPVGPVDLRWDRSRRVWVSPPSHRLIAAQLCDDLCNGAGSWQWASIVDCPEVYDCDGLVISSQLIKVYDTIGLGIASGTKVYCYYDPLDCKYYILNQASPIVCVSGEVNCGNIEALDPCTTAYKRIIYGDGLKVGISGDDVCSLRISATGHGLRFDCGPTGSGCVDVCDASGDFIYRKLDIGNGIRIKHMSGSGICDPENRAMIGGGIVVRHSGQEIDPVTQLEFNTCFMVESGDGGGTWGECGAKISLSGYTGSIQVSGCSGDCLTLTYNCGLLTSVL